MIIAVIITACHPLNHLEGLGIGRQLQRPLVDIRRAIFQIFTVCLAIVLKGLGTEEIEVVEIAITVPCVMNTQFT